MNTEINHQAVLIAVRELQRADSPLRAGSRYVIRHLLGVDLPEDTVAPSEAGTTFEAAAAWVRNAAVRA